MSEPLFREEALDYVARQSGPGEVVRVSAPWMDAAYWAFLALVVAGAIAAVPLVRALYG
jgi:hypothetical protein